MNWKGTALGLALLFIIGCAGRTPPPLGDPGRWVDSDGHGITWAAPPAGTGGHFVTYTDGPYRGNVYEAHRNAQRQYYIQREGKTVRVYFTGTYSIKSVAWYTPDGYSMGWEFPPPGRSTKSAYVVYGDGPYLGKVYQVHKDRSGRYYIQRDGERVSIFRDEEYGR